MRAELERLRDELSVEFAARLREARAFGKVSSNDDYLQIKEEIDVLASRIASLEATLSSATVVSEDDGQSATVAIGVLVKVRDWDSGAVDEYLLIGDFDPPRPSAASAGSPVGRALLGRVVGDEVDVELPDGRTRRLKIVSSRHSTKDRLSGGR
jgi:transcription elongation factor GreA